jgi:transposase
MKQKQKSELMKFIKHTKEGAAAKRALAVSLLDTGGDVSLTGYTHKHAERLRRDFITKGIDAFEDHRKNNRDRILTAQEKQQVITILRTKQPKDVIPACTVECWTTGLLGLYIKREFSKEYKSKTSERLLFREAHLTFHMPGRRYENANEKAVATWKKTIQPILNTHWADASTIILCEDEMVLTSKTTTQKVWLPKGEYPPVIETNSTRKRKNFYGFLNLKTGQQHTYITDKQNMLVTVKVLKKIRKLYTKNKIVLFWDNCGWHKGSAVTEYIEQDGNIEIVWFPSYAPELNPQEHVWKEGRKVITHNQHITKIEDTAQQFKDYITERVFDYALLGLRSSLAQV